jgi:hypothetical protein
MRRLAVTALLAGVPALGFAADGDWQSQIGEALGKRTASSAWSTACGAFRHVLLLKL